MQNMIIDEFEELAKKYKKEFDNGNPECGCFYEGNEFITKVRELLQRHLTMRAVDVGYCPEG